MVIGLDIGYGYTKTIFLNGDAEQRFIFPSRVGTYIPKKSFNESFDTVVVNGKQYIVGNDTEGSSRLTADFVGTDEYLAVIGYSLSRANIIKRIIVLGLPPQAYEEERINFFKERIRQADIRLSDGTKIYLPERIEFIPQGVGIYFAYLTENGLADTERTSVVVDIGYHTMDIVLFAGGKFRAHMSRSYPLGVKVLYDMIRDAYIKKYSIFVSPDRDELVEKLLSTKSVPHLDEMHTIDVQSILNDFYTGKIIKTLGGYISDAEEYGYMIERIILGGGGIWYMGNVSGAYVVRDPQMANAKGFMEYG